MLSFLSPVFLAGAFAAAIPIVLHLLKREPEPRVKFAAVRLLKQAPVEYTERRHIRELLLLALRVAALLLLALAFARPFLPSRAALSSSGTTIVALDTSFSLSAPGRFERARQMAKDAIARVPSSDSVGVVTFADEAEIVAKPGEDRVLAASAIDRAEVGFGATRYRAALSAAGQALAGRTGAIVVVTDLQESGWDAGDRASIPEGVKIEVLDVGEPPPNFAVTAMRALPDRMVATVRNAAPRARDAHLHLTIDGRRAGDATLTLAPNQSAEATFAGAPRGNAAAVTVDDPDGLQADNTRYMALGGHKSPSVLLVTGSGDAGRDAFYVQQALAAGESAGRGHQVAGMSGAQLSSTDAASLAEHPAVLLLSTRGLERRGREALASYVRNGGGMLIAAGPDVDGDVVADVLGQQSTLRVATGAGSRPAPNTLAPADVRHPVFRRFAGTTATFGLVTFQTAARISGNECQTLARFTTGETALLECPAGEGRALVLASDLDNRWNDFPLHASFVPFLHETVRYLGSAGARGAEYLVADAPTSAKHTPGVVTIADPSHPGAAPRRIAVNVDPRETDPSRLSIDDFQSAVTRLKDTGRSAARVEARQQEDRQHLWQYALALLVATLVVEGLLAARTA